MSDAVVLRFQYRGDDVDLVVEDIDKVNLIDLVIEYWDKATESSKPQPKHPSFQYVYKMKHVVLNNDRDLMKMFSNLPGKEFIYIWVGDAVEPSQLIKTARTLRDSKLASEGNQNVGDMGHIVADSSVVPPRRSLIGQEGSFKKPDPDLVAMYNKQIEEFKVESSARKNQKGKAPMVVEQLVLQPVQILRRSPKKRAQTHGELTKTIRVDNQSVMVPPMSEVHMIRGGNFEDKGGLQGLFTQLHP
uniref:Uncharacterized protein n=1 Tax=Chenopodium quinoa TaxID=63459 RepID=A0A803NCC7_CHEQI